jgi:NAD(P)-dependent dehydrogenase (short-subunit alcohol dehydrogenase family)
VEVCRQLAQAGFTVWLTARDPERAAQVAGTFGIDGQVRSARLDVTDQDSVDALSKHIEHLDVLVNNAAIDYDTDAQAMTVDLDRVGRSLDTNLLGAWRMVQTFGAQLTSSAHGRIVNVSSGGGSITEIGAGLPGYQLSKLALNGLTKIVAAELRPSGVLVNSVCPGWTATDMGGGGKPVEDGARSVTWACLLPDDGPTGGFFRDGQPLPW